MIQETLRFFIGVVVFVVALLGFAAMLSGCSRDDLTYMKCIVKDNTTYHC